jgi:hypothetical protein
MRKSGDLDIVVKEVMNWLSIPENSWLTEVLRVRKLAAMSTTLISISPVPIRDQSRSPLVFPILVSWGRLLNWNGLIVGMHRRYLGSDTEEASKVGS